MKQIRISGLVCGAFFLFVAAGFAASPTDVTIAQLSDTHLGEKHSPQAAENLRKAVDMINARNPDAVILSGDIGENIDERDQAKTILKALHAPVYYVPGNHDVSNTTNLANYREQFGPDYYRFQVKNVEVLALDSGLLGNYGKFGPLALPPLPPDMEAESQKMLDWLAGQAGATNGQVVIAVQHVPLFRDEGFPDGKPYWVINTPYRERETDLLHKLGVRHLLAGHWHNGRVFKRDGITIHVAPAIGYPIGVGGQLGFAMHIITPEGNVRTEFVPLPKATHQSELL